jgi:hypothetical protein
VGAIEEINICIRLIKLIFGVLRMVWILVSQFFGKCGFGCLGGWVFTFFGMGIGDV